MRVRIVYCYIQLIQPSHLIQPVCARTGYPDDKKRFYMDLHLLNNFNEILKLVWRMELKLFSKVRLENSLSQAHIWGKLTAVSPPFRSPEKSNCGKFLAAMTFFLKQAVQKRGSSSLQLDITRSCRHAVNSLSSIKRKRARRQELMC